jgi:predicted permease
MDTLWQDVRYSLRLLARAPIFTAILVLTLALGIGANTAIFNLMDQALLRGLPVERPAELVALHGPGPNQGMLQGEMDVPLPFSYPMYTDFRDRSPVFSGVIGRFGTAAAITSNGTTEPARVELVTGNFFDVLGVEAVIGRTLSPDDDRTPGAHPVAVLSHRYWTERFGADPSVLNRVVRVNATPMTIVGVTPAKFNGVYLGSAVDLFVPVMMKAQMTPTWDELSNRRARWLYVLARRKPGVSREQASSAMNVLYRQINEAEIKTIPGGSERFRKQFVEKRLELLPGGKGLSDQREQVTTPFLVLMAMVGLVLAIACANVANLLLARATAREREIAVRLAIGAGRGRLVRQLLVESLLVAAGGVLAGLLVAGWTADLLIRALPGEDAAHIFTALPDLRVIAFAIVLGVVTGLTFGLVPALQATRPALTTALNSETGRVAGRTHARLRKSLVVAQVALSLLLLIGAGLFLRSLANLRKVDVGFKADHLLTFAIDPSLNGYTQERTQQLFGRLRQELAALPGVVSASLAKEPIMTRSESSRTVRVDGYRAAEGENMNPTLNTIAPGYFTTLSVPLVAGRDFTEADRAEAPRVAIVNEVMARRYWGETSPIGKRIGFGSRRTEFDIEIVGVVRDGKYASLKDEARRFIYLPYQQDDRLANVTMYVRTHGDPLAITNSARAVVARADSTLPITQVRTMEMTIDESLFLDRFVAMLSAAFGALATLLAAIGLYGVMSYLVGRRTREIGIRMALGAARSEVLWLVLREVAVLAAIGAAIGLPLAVGLGLLLRSQLFGLQPIDPWSIGTALAALALVALAAGYLPARRASAVDPMVALRYE